MAVEAMVMTEMLVVMPVMMMAVMVVAHPGIGAVHARMHVDGPCAMRGPARTVGHRGRHNKHGSRKPAAEIVFSMVVSPPDIARWPAG